MTKAKADTEAMSRGDITSKARQACYLARHAAQAAEELVARMSDTSQESAAGAARAHQEAVGHLNDALSLLNELATRRSSDTSKKKGGRK